MKALFFDIDGTLLSEKTHQVPESAIRAIEAARKNGCLSFINSGRCECMLKEMESILPMDGVLAGCGTELTYHGERIFYYPLPDELQQKIVHADRKYNVGIVAEGSEINHYRPEVSRMEVMNFMREQTGRIHALSTEDFEGHYEISKFCIQADEESDMDGIRAEFEKDFDIMDRRGGFYECVPRGFDKGQAILHMAELLNIDMDDVYVFGDSSNDLPMFRTAPAHSTAMKKHDPVLDPYAAYVTDKVEEHGIEKALKHWKLI
jgi:Cof subfamily protein (haloacid dehalogenase superfamily)